jgi:hypothetical protein
MPSATARLIRQRSELLVVSRTDHTIMTGHTALRWWPGTRSWTRWNACAVPAAPARATSWSPLRLAGPGAGTPHSPILTIGACPVALLCFRFGLSAASDGERCSRPSGAKTSGSLCPQPEQRAAGSLGIDPVKPITLIGVAALGAPDLLVEVEATAVLS